jgi:hypothetical protein
MDDFLILDNLVDIKDQEILENLFVDQEELPYADVVSLRKGPSPFPQWYFNKASCPYLFTKDRNSAWGKWEKAWKAEYNPIFRREKDLPWFAHNILLTNDCGITKVVSSFAKDILRIFNDLNLDRYNQYIRAKNLSRIRCNLFPPQKRIGYFNSTPMHVDIINPDGATIDHYVMLYYINDSDGETILHNVGKVKPKKGRIVIFDGSIAHKLKYPTKGYRCIINFNFRKTN